jgi:hypothetical protein
MYYNTGILLRALNLEVLRKGEVAVQPDSIRNNQRGATVEQISGLFALRAFSERGRFGIRVLLFGHANRPATDKNWKWL